MQKRAFLKHPVFDLIPTHVSHILSGCPDVGAMEPKPPGGPQ